MSPPTKASWLAAALLGASLLGGAPGAIPRLPAHLQEGEDPQAKRLEELVERYNENRRRHHEAYSKATSAEDKKAAAEAMKGRAFAPEFRALAEEARGTDTALRAWLWVLRTGAEPEEARAIVARLLAEHAASAAMAELIGELRYGSERVGTSAAHEALRTLQADSPHESVRALACFTLGTLLLDSDVPAIQSEGRACMQTVVERYGELPYGGRSTFGQAAGRFLYELDHLQIGMVAPDFESVDENGVAWKLSDYRGKVVVVDFWGFW